MRKTVTELGLALYLNYKGVKFKRALHMNQHRPSLVVNCSAIFSQDTVHESLIYTNIIYTNIHIANTHEDP